MRWTPLLIWLLGCPPAPTGTDSDAGGDTAEAVGHQGPKPGGGALPSGPPKGVGGVAFPGATEMPTGIVAAGTPVEPGDPTPTPISGRAGRRQLASDSQYVRFFVTISDAGTVGLAGEAIPLSGNLVTPPRPVGPLLVVSGNSGGALGVASFRDPRARQGMNLVDVGASHQADPQVVGRLNLSAPVGTTTIAVWELPPDAIPWDTPLTVANVPTLTADATLLGTVEYKP